MLAYFLIEWCKEKKKKPLFPGSLNFLAWPDSLKFFENIGEGDSGSPSPSANNTLLLSFLGRLFISGSPKEHENYILCRCSRVSHEP